MNASERSYDRFRKVGILVEKVGILVETSFGAKNSTVTTRSSSPALKTDSERRSRRQHRIEGTSVRDERVFTVGTGVARKRARGSLDGPMNGLA